MKERYSKSPRPAKGTADLTKQSILHTWQSCATKAKLRGDLDVNKQTFSLCFLYVIYM